MRSPKTLQSFSSEVAAAVIGLDWRAGRLPDSLEAKVPAGVEPFEVAAALRLADATAAYACADRDADGWFVVCMPDDPAPAQTSELPADSPVWRTKVNVSARAAPRMSGEFVLFGPNAEYLERVCRRLNVIGPRVFNIVHDLISPVDFGDDFNPADPTNAVHPSWVDDGSNLLNLIEAVGGIASYIRRVYPKDVPDNATLARQLATVFEGL